MMVKKYTFEGFQKIDQNDIQMAFLKNALELNPCTLIKKLEWHAHISQLYLSTHTKCTERPDRQKP